MWSPGFEIANNNNHDDYTGFLIALRSRETLSLLSAGFEVNSFFASFETDDTRGSLAAARCSVTRGGEECRTRGQVSPARCDGNFI